MIDPEVKDQTWTISRIAQTITVTGSYEKSADSAPFLLDAKTNNTDSNAKLTYQSSNTKVAAVDANGKVTIAGPGTAVITVIAAATANYEAAGKTVTIIVRDNMKPVPDPEITKESIAKASVTVSSQKYTGKELKPCVKVVLSGKTLKAGTDYTVSYSNNKNIGTAAVKVTGKGSYSGSITKKFTIYVAKNASYTVGNYQYKITNASTNGKGAVTLTSVKKKTSSASIESTVTIGGKKFKITAIGANAFKKNTKVTNLTIGANVKTIGSNAFYGCKKLKNITIKTTQLKSSAVGSKAFSGVYSKVKVCVPASKVSTYKKLMQSRGLSKNAVFVADISGAKISVSKQKYTGKTLKPSVKVVLSKKTLKAGRDYTVSYSRNKNIGTAAVKITGKGKYGGSVTKNFTIYVAKNASYTIGNYKYKITNASTNGKGTVSLTGVKKDASTVSIGSTVTIGGKKFKITAIGANAFKNSKKLAKVTIGANVKTIGSSAFNGCRKLKSITIKTTLLKSSTVGNKAFSGVYSKAAVKVPASKVSEYKKLLQSKGLPKSAKVSK